MTRNQRTAVLACSMLAAPALLVAPWLVLPLGAALLVGWDAL